MSWRNLLAVPVVLSVVGSAIPTSAAPANIFNPHLDEIRQNLPRGYAMRLPSQIRLGGIADDEFINQLVVRVFPSTTPGGMTVGLFTCKTGPQPCLVGTFAVDSKNSPSVVRELEKHQAAGDVITLSPGVKGYLLEGFDQNPQVPFSSMVWQQDGLIYTLSFLAEERENIILMGDSMAREAPIRGAR